MDKEQLSRQATLLKKAAEGVRALGRVKEAQAQLEEKIALFEREKKAEEIALMLVASDALDMEDLLAKRASLVESAADLDQMKTAMQAYGPSRAGGQPPVELAKQAAGPSFTVETQQQATGPVPAHILAARKELEDAMSSFE